MWHHLIHFLALLLLASDAGAQDNDCNEVVCGSVVSKCLLTQDCQCKLNDCHCCQDCINCLGDLFFECCGCLDMCPTDKEAPAALSTRSEIGNLLGEEQIYDKLTEEDDLRWSTIRLTMRADFKQRLEGGGGGPSEHKPGSTLNCTVVYWNSCLPSNKCSEQCESMGANSYRWFHDGCCECVGANCLNYGINESKCAECPGTEDAEAELEEDAFSEDLLDYGESDDLFM